jgi:stage II sporulation protein D
MIFPSRKWAGLLMGLGLIFLGAGSNQLRAETEKNVCPAPGIETAPLPLSMPLAPLGNWREVLSGKRPIRIRLATDVKTVSLICREPFQIVSQNGDNREGQPGETMSFSGTMKYPVVLRAENGGSWQITIDDKPLPGNYPATLRVFSTGTGSSARLTLVNILPLEAYVAGVTEKEMGSGFGLEALRAQAIAIRSYTLYYLGRHGAEAADLCAGYHCQVYHGIPDPLSRTAYAAYSTKGQILLYKEQPIRANYFSTCGGETAAATFLNTAPIDFPYLTSISDRASDPPSLTDEKQISDFLHQKPDSFCAISPRYRWSATYTADELNALVSQNLDERICRPGLKPGKVKSLQVIRRSGGRAQVLQIDTESGTYTVEGDNIRWLFNPKPLQSAFFVLDLEKNRHGKIKKYTFIGGGWGHGVGMCQFGAEGRARAGQSAAEILQAYYPGTELWTTEVIVPKEISND